MNWDDLKFFLAVCNHGSIRAAAKSLGVNHATVSRRINAFESAVGKRLFERTPQGYVKTLMADKIFADAHHLEQKLDTLSRQIMADEDELSGEIRVTLPLIIGQDILLPIFSEFCHQYPQIELEILESAELFKLTNRDADIAFRICSQPPDHLIGKKLATLHRACYIGKQYAQKLNDEKWLNQLNWIGWNDQMRKPAGKIARDYPKLSSKHKILDALLQVKACESGMGVAVLPCFLADSNPNLIRIPPYTSEAKYDLWLLYHPDLRNNIKIQQFIRIVVAGLRSSSDLFEGREYSNDSTLTQA